MLLFIFLLSCIIAYQSAYALSNRRNSLIFAPSKFPRVNRNQLPAKVALFRCSMASTSISSFEFQNKTIDSIPTSINLAEFSDIQSLNARLDKIEKSVSSLQSTVSTQLSNPISSFVRGPTLKSDIVGNFVDSLTATTIPINPRTVEIASVVSFFFIGAILSSSLLDRLWLLGGIFCSWWASGAVYRDSRGGMLARRVGVQLIQFVKDLQEKYNQLVIFYRTGKLAYITSQYWEVYDKKYGIEGKINEFKRLAMKRATEFNTAFQDQSGLSQQINDFLTVIQSAPSNAKKLNEQYGVTSSLYSFSKGLYSSAIVGVRQLSDTFSGGSQEDTRNLKPYKLSKGRKRFSYHSKGKAKHRPIGPTPFFNRIFKFHQEPTSIQPKSSYSLLFPWSKPKPKPVKESAISKVTSALQGLANGLKRSFAEEEERPIINPWGGPFNAYKRNGYKYIRRV